jgi:hypothetical protein
MLPRLLLPPATKRGWMVTLSLSIFGGPGFKAWPRDRLSWLIFLVVFLSPSRHMLGLYLKIRPQLLTSRSFAIYHLLDTPTFDSTTPPVPPILLSCASNGLPRHCTAYPCLRARFMIRLKFYYQSVSVTPIWSIGHPPPPNFVPCCHLHFIPL